MYNVLFFVNFMVTVILYMVPHVMSRTLVEIEQECMRCELNFLNEIEFSCICYDITLNR